MTTPRKIIAAKNDSNGNIAHVKIEGNKNFTPIKTAIRMAESEKIDAIAVHPKNKKTHLRTKPDGKEENNLDYLASNE